MVSSAAGAAAAIRTLARGSVFVPLALLLGVTLLLLPPSGNFPLNDDWVYAQRVRELLETGRLGSSQMALALAQTLWGGLFAGVFGFTYTVLRVSTLFLALATLWLTGRCAGLLGLPRWTAVACGAVLLCDPLFLSLAYTFMTEVPFLAPLTAAGFFFMRLLRDGRPRDAALAGILSVVAASSRQFGVLLPLAYVICELLLLRVRRTRLRPLGAALLAAPWAIAIPLYFLLPTLEERPEAITDLARVTVASVATLTFQTTFTVLLYCGLFVLPLTLSRLVQLLRRRGAWARWQWTAFPWCLLAVFAGSSAIQGGILFQRPLPRLGNVLRDLGTGPLTLRDTYLMGMPPPVQVGGWWWVPTVLAIVSVALLLCDVVLPLLGDCWRLIARRAGAGADPEETGQRLLVLLWGGAFAFAPYHLVMSGTFDRYLIPALPPLVILAASRLELRADRGAAAALAAAGGLMFFFSLASVQDYLSWNRARWEGIAYLLGEVKAPAEKIDAGYEFNGLYTRELHRKIYGERQHNWGAKGFWVLDDEFAVSFNPRAGTSVLKRIPYFSWLGMEERALLVLKRQ